ncbi:MAG: hypothetical protein ACYS83_08205 [Planctomycetota bacterium]
MDCCVGAGELDVGFMMNRKRLHSWLSLGMAYVAFALHMTCVIRWTVIHYTYGNQKSIPVDPFKAYLFYILVAMLSLQPLLLSTVRKHTRGFLALSTALNLVAFGYTGWLLHSGIVRFIR